MVSEGVDVPRAACLAWLTSYRTPLFFAQAVGRVVRARGRHESATVFLPAVRPLLAMAAELEVERDHVLVAKASADGLDDVDAASRRETESTASLEWSPVDAQAAFAHVLYGGRAVVPAEGIPTTEDDDEFLGIPGFLSPEQTAALLKQREAEHRRVAAARNAVDPPPREESTREQSAALRREINRLVSRIARQTGQPHAALHARLRRRVPGPPSSSAGLSILASRRDWLMKELGGA